MAIIKPWGRSSSDGWEWDGRILKPWGKSSSYGWEFDGRILKPWGKSSSYGWEVKGGRVPIPVLALFAMGVI